MIDELAESRKEDGDGVIVIAEIAMDGGRNVTGGGQLFAGDWNARHADVCVLDDLIGRLFDLNGWLQSFFEEYGKKGKKNTVGVVGRQKMAELGWNGAPVWIVQIVARSVVVAESPRFALYRFGAKATDARFENIDQWQCRLNFVRF